MRETSEPINLTARIERSLRYRTGHYAGLIQQEMNEIKDKARTLRWECESRIDKRLVRRRFPQLGTYAELADEKRKKLLPYYHDYISRISTEDSAISLELSAFLLVICDFLTPTSILDTGSGFSSFVFRHYMINAAHRPIVCSVDDNEGWLEKTRSFLKHCDVPSNNVFDWRYFAEKNEEKFDLILHDLGGNPTDMSVRKNALKPILALSRPGGVVILDDVHMKAYRPDAMKTLNDSGLKHYSLRSFTLDKFGRFSEIVCNGI